jgi:dolichol-phosphate mannosyltransferase
MKSDGGTQRSGLSIIVPTYNEAENVRELIEKVEASLKGLDFEVVVVDDSSPDGTAEIAEELGRAYGNVKVIKRPRKMGWPQQPWRGWERRSTGL